MSFFSRSVKLLTTCYGFYLLIFIATFLLGVYSNRFTLALDSLHKYLEYQNKRSMPKISNLLGISINEFQSLTLLKLFKIFDSLESNKKENSSDK